MPGGIARFPFERMVTSVITYSNEDLLGDFHVPTLVRIERERRVTVQWSLDSRETKVY